jgi:alginate O-acetyltransferase complex protein AlgI
MSFNSFPFFIFFPIVTILYFFLPHKLRWVHLLTASCLFYMFFIPKYILILFFTIIVDYITGILIENAEGKRRKLFLSLSIAANVGVLCIFKYYNFFSDNVNEALQLLHFHAHPLPMLKYVLPIGLSFHTFQAMSYTIEVYRGNQKAERHIGIYALYVMFYPQLVAGPIERPQNLLHQFREKHEFIYADVIVGLKLMLWGFFKKVVIADSIGTLITPVFHNPNSFSAISILFAVVLFPFQIYCDFAGYSDIAIGAARVMGFKLMRNFNFPYIAKNMSDFWRRWHISLSTWLNDYLFTPISISRRNWDKWAVIFSLNITFFLAGLWHGASWNFVVFGVLNGLALSYDVLSRKFRKNIASAVPAPVYANLSMVLTFLYWAMCLVFFRTESISSSLYVIKCVPHGLWNIIHVNRLNALAFGGQAALLNLLWILLLVILLEYAEYLQRKINLIAYLNQKPVYLRWAVYYIMIAAILGLSSTGQGSFIYFQF